MELLQKHFDIALETPDGVKKLRELILTLAMQGKLVPHDPKEQPARDLLKEIEAEKKILVKDGKIKNQEPLPPIKREEIPYEVPKEWEWVRLGSVSLINGGFAFKSSQYVQDGVRVIRISDFDERGFKNDKVVRYTFSKDLDDFLVEENNILMAMTGGTVGKSYLVRMLPEKLVVNQRVATIKLYKNVVPEYINALIQTSLIQNVIQNAKNSTNDNISMVDIKGFFVPLPPLAEQKRIVAKIDQLMALCDKLEAERNERDKKRLTIHTAAMSRLLTAADKTAFNTSWNFINKNFSALYLVSENVEDLKKAILQLAVMGKLVPQDPRDEPATELLKEIEAKKKKLIKEGKIKQNNPLPAVKPDEIPYEIPKGWTWVRLNDVFDVRDGTHDTPKYTNTGVPLITSKNIYTGTLSFNDVKLISNEDHIKIKERSNVERGDILFAMIGSIGNPVIVNTDQEFSIKNVALFKYYDGNLTDNNYLHKFLVFAQSHMKAKSSGAVQSFVSLSFLRNYLFPVPPLNEQKRIVAKIDQLLEFCNVLGQQITDSAEKQTAILDAVLARL